MNRASPVDLRKAIELATQLMRAGVLFVPMPALNEDDHAALVTQMEHRLELIASECE